MGQAKYGMEKLTLDEKTENLIAIGAAAASNCIPCFEHLYEKAITSGVTVTQIKRATDIAGQVKNGAHTALTNSINDTIGEKGTVDLPCMKTAKRSCCS